MHRMVIHDTQMAQYHISIYPVSALMLRHIYSSKFGDILDVFFKQKKCEALFKQVNIY